MADEERKAAVVDLEHSEAAVPGDRVAKEAERAVDLNGRKKMRAAERLKNESKKIN